LDIKTIRPAYEDERGSIWDFLTNENIQHVGYLKTIKGSIRGKHFHKEQNQYTMVFHGKIKLVTKNLLEKDAPKEEVILNKMDIVFHPAFHYHSIEALEDSECLIFTSKARTQSSYEDDTFRVEDIDHFELKKGANN